MAVVRRLRREQNPAYRPSGRAVSAFPELRAGLRFTEAARPFDTAMLRCTKCLAERRRHDCAEGHAIIAFDEMNGTDGAMRAQYAAVKRWLDRTPEDIIDFKMAAAEGVFRRLGVTFAVYSVY